MQSEETQHLRQVRRDRLYGWRSAQAPEGVRGCAERHRQGLENDPETRSPSAQRTRSRQQRMCRQRRFRQVRSDAASFHPQR